MIYHKESCGEMRGESIMLTSEDMCVTRIRITFATKQGCMCHLKYINDKHISTLEKFKLSFFMYIFQINNTKLEICYISI